MTLRLRYTTALAVAVSFAIGSGCTDTGCEDALEQTTKLTHEICDEEAAYGGTPFCSICVKAGRLSTTGPTDCRCTLLAYDQGVCSTPPDDDAKSSIRAAIKWANESCKTFTLAEPGGEGGQGGGQADPSSD
jgi:hypothetical protein